jgi:hypothetical protein
MDYFVGTGHGNVCKPYNNPIIIERRLYSFYSMFKYWKAGAVDGLYKRTPAFKAKYANVTILDFIAMLKANSGELISGLRGVSILQRRFTG